MNTTKVKAYKAQEQVQRATLEGLLNRLNDLNAIGASLSSERNIDKLLESILSAAMKITNADAGTLYLVDTEEQVLTFEIVHNLSLDIRMGGTSGNPIPFYPIKLCKDGLDNHAMVVSHAALSGETVNIPDAYIAEGFDFSGTKQFDAKTGYRSHSFLTVPMRNHEHEIIGVLQLINALDEKGGVQQFSLDDQKLLESLASQAAIAISNRRLIQQLEELFESFIKLINTAIDDKSPYTGGHCARVPALTMMLAEAASRTDEGELKDFKLTDQDRYELKMAGLLHDCGKITTPVHVVDKATKLHTLFDRIRLIDTRFEVLKRDAEIEMLRGVISEDLFMQRVAQADDDREFLRHCNIGGEKMSDEDVERVQRIARYRWRNAAGVAEDFLSADELENLTIRAGTLTAAEREIINHHIVVTIKMLESLPWPKHLKRVPEYAGGHHERMDGKGYPKGLTREQMSVQARLMGIADIFEALTAKDRPYKPGKTLTESLNILGNFKLNGHIDPELFDAFIRERVYLEYAHRFLSPEQIDDVAEGSIPGYKP
ncbi:MAG: HD domain-containing phosphohydrolase [Sideroxydans sp.]|jgi:HD-GYP domain-containing protein (c-di-GMP phosphodiesterase class II)